MIKIFTKRSVPKRTLLLLLCLYLGVKAYAQTPAVKGVVKDAKETIVGATIIAQNVQTGVRTTTSSDKNGVFTFVRLAAGPYRFTINFIGYESNIVTGIVKDGGTFSLSVVLKESSTSLDKEVVVTGTGINRRKDSFTGTTAVFSGEELKTIGNNNIIQSLRTLDPSFLQIENNLAGSNPNVLPVIEVRGKSSIPSSTLKDQFGSDPNQPLFVLDGFPTTLQTIVDLDMNRVASVTILKDAASTALYGSQASNGVVVIETIKPKPGELRFSYTQDFRLEMADLSAYNMMNATEKLEFERLSGRYVTSEANPVQNVYLDSLYNAHLGNVRKGINTYWLNVPLQTGYSTNNSINASGGDNAFIYNVGMNYRTGQGAMIGSGRDTYSGSINLNYRKQKINVNNITYIRGYSSQNSQYGSFSNFVNANPYFRKDSESLYLERPRTTSGSGFNVINPIYDALQPQYDQTKNSEFQNNLNAIYDISSAFRINGALQITKGTTTTKVYKSPEMSDFINTPTLRKGTYSDNRAENFSYQANLTLSYNKMFGQKNSITANWRSTVQQNKNSSYSSKAEGFPAGSLGNPRFAYAYALDGAPSATSGIYRSLSSAVALNYSYANKYLADFVFRLDGSTAYGSNKQYSPYYSFGLGWNIHNEDFAKQASWLNSLRLTANIGITGNQNFGNLSSVSIYNYNSNTQYNSFGQGLSLLTLGNPNLEPQKTRQISTSIEFVLLKNRLSGYINAYNKRTNPLIVPVDLPSSTGVFAFPYNIGSLTYNGIETRISYSPVYDLAKGIVWSVSLTGSTYRSKYGGFGNTLNTLNKQQENSKTLLRYIDGNSAEAIWAIKSMGIDPATGREVFLTKDGQYTFDYNTGNIVNVGNTVPVAEGVISTNLRYKGFNFGLGLRYRVGGDIFNNALYNKVENISSTSIANNQDRRALYDRWKNPGDVSQFKGISLTSTTPISSRFVQKENTLSSETLSVGYTFDGKQWLRAVGMRTLNATLFGNDFLYLSTVRRERGIDYPYARTFAFSLRASF
ncbi:SusC/RagA family TonB-linked outer membrane protein [Pedobacter zeae]|uniref:SusC/RagA family TonB-linked outer membrane protein n=1 Tax=Pedobacter zeae TaxID=1737356 RepID=A0A7W6KD49_9SPHI|nr:SusC/RagA family TonB-linked outer membrane protein [Pedobacter zeae]MBB4109510.1 TonB-linked SusC/RagA family outer membrane protein [Pedobacter zeae]GGH12648.1 SusC/RagA family TonB-linked outer membrane protein [Pedobacter zeae]